jgi:site-specific recombinase XerD
MQEDAPGSASAPKGRELPLAVNGFVRSLIAAGYSPRTIDACLSDLAQFSAFVNDRGVDSVERVTRGDVT